MRPFGLMTGVFGCTRSATDPRRAAIGELLSGAAGERNPITVTSDPGLRFRVVDALADLVEELALAGPVGDRRGRPAVGRRVEPADAGRAGTPGRIPSGGPHRVLPAVAPLPRAGPARRLAGGGAGPVPEPGRSGRAGGGRPGRRRGGRDAGPGAAGRAGGRGGQPAVRHRDAGRAGAGGHDRDGRRTGRGGAAGAAAHAAADDPAPAELPVRRHAPGAAVRLDPGVQLHRHRSVGDDGPARGRAVRRAGRGDRRAGARGRRRPAPVPARRHPRRHLRGHAGHHPPRPAPRGRAAAGADRGARPPGGRASGPRGRPRRHRGRRLAVPGRPGGRGDIPGRGRGAAGAGGGADGARAIPAATACWPSRPAA